MSDADKTVILNLDDVNDTPVNTSGVDALFDDVSFDDMAEAREVARLEQAEMEVGPSEFTQLLAPAELAKAVKQPKAKTKKADVVPTASSGGEAVENAPQTDAERVKSMLKTVGKKASTVGKPKPTAETQKAATAAAQAPKIKVSKTAKTDEPKISKAEERKQLAQKRKDDAAADKKSIAEKKEKAKADREAKKAEKEALSLAESRPNGYELPDEFVINDFEEGIQKITDCITNVTDAKFRVGWYLLGINAEYGKKTLETIAGAVKETKSTLQKWRWVMREFSPEDVNMFHELNFSHFQEVAKVAKTRGKEAAIACLKVARMDETGNVMSIEKFHQWLHKDDTKPEPPRDFIQVPGGDFFIVESIEQFTELFQQGRIFMGVWTTDKGNWAEDATEASLFQGLTKATFKSLNKE